MWAFGFVKEERTDILWHEVLLVKHLTLFLLNLYYLCGLGIFLSRKDVFRTINKYSHNEKKMVR